MLRVQQVVLPRQQIHLVVRGQRTALLIPRGEERGDRPPFHAGSTIALQPAPSRPATCRVAVSRVSDIALGELDDDQARELGHRDIYALQAAWYENGHQWDPAARAWLLRIAVDSAAAPRLLHRDSTHGYTTRVHDALPDEPEAVDDVRLAAGRRHAEKTERDRFEQLLAERRGLPAPDRLRLALDDARARGIDIEADPDARKIVLRIADFERKVYRPAERSPELA